MTRQRCRNCGVTILHDSLGWYHTDMPKGPDGKPIPNPPPCTATPGGAPQPGQGDLFAVK